MPRPLRLHAPGAVYHVTLDQLQSTSRRRDLVKARAWVALQALNGRISSLAGVARLFNRDESSLRHGITQTSRSVT